VVQQEEGVRICDGRGREGVFLPPHRHNGRGVQIFEEGRVRKWRGSLDGRRKEQTGKDSSANKLGAANVRGRALRSAKLRRAVASR